MQAIKNILKLNDKLFVQVFILISLTTAAILYVRLNSPLCNPDSYYHLGCAELYMRKGWLSSFPWLEYTVLGEHFPNVHLLQHLIFAPFTLIFSKINLITLAPLLTAVLLLISVFIVLRRWEIQQAHLWALLALFSSPLLVSYLTLLKGGSLFFVFLVFYVDALFRKQDKLLLIISWLTVYAYVGAPVLLMIAFLFSLTISLSEKLIYYKPLLYTALGILGGLLINPFFPENIFHIERELLSPFNTPSYLDAGTFKGSEWIPLKVNSFIAYSGLAISTWFICICIALRKERIKNEILALLVCSFAFFAASLVVGTKLLFLFLLLSSLSLPLLISKHLALKKSLLGVLAIVAFASSINSIRLVYHMDDKNVRPKAIDYQIIAEFISKNSEENEMVLSFWDDFPGLFYFNKRNRYVVGMNPSFLHDANEKLFKAYYYLYKGQVNDPEKLLPTFFKDAKIILVRMPYRNQGERKLAESLSANKSFGELKSPSEFWKVYQLKAL